MVSYITHIHPKPNTEKSDTNIQTNDLDYVSKMLHFLMIATISFHSSNSNHDQIDPIRSVVDFHITCVKSPLMDQLTGGEINQLKMFSSAISKKGNNV